MALNERSFVHHIWTASFRRCPARPIFGLLAATLALCLLVGEVLAVSGAPRPTRSALQDTLRVGDDAPTFVMDDLSTGEPVFLSDYTGTTLRQPWKNSARHVVVICFWSSWSEPSTEEIAALSALAGKLANKPVKVFLVNTGERAGVTRESLRTVVGERGYTLTVLVDATGTVADRYGVQQLPQTAVADKQGVLRMLHRGPGSLAGGELEALVNALAEKP